jgi:hypothetical protein
MPKRIVFKKTGLPMADPGKRLKILTDSEIKVLYGLPEFNFEERAEYFALSQAEEDVLRGAEPIPAISRSRQDDSRLRVAL